MTIAATLCIFLLTANDSPSVTSIADHDDSHRLELFAGPGYLASSGFSGAAFTVGARYELTRHFALSFDYGFGLVSSATDYEDRWWLIPSLEISQPLGRVRFDLGGGVGLATSSGYANAPTFFDGPFKPAWAFQLAPAARAYASATYELDPRWKLFARADAGTLLLGGSSLGWRAGNDNPSTGQTTWFMLWVGARFGLL